MKQRNLVWLFIDSFSNLWVNEDTMPYLNSLLKNTVYFEQAVTVCPYTAGSWFSQITGRNMQANGHTGYHLSCTYAKNKEAFEKGGYHKQSNLAAALHDAGYYTQFSSPTVGNKDWTRGWDKSDWCKHPAPHGDGDPSGRSLEMPPREPYFFAFHYLKAHHYTTKDMPSNMDRARFLEEFLPSLDEEIRCFVDKYVSPDDLLVLTSDHGSSWDGKRERHHGASMVESGIRILFAIRGAGVTGRIPQMVRSIDIGPTIAGLLGVSDGMTDWTLGPRERGPDGIDLLKDKSYPPRIPKLQAIIETGASDSCPHWHNIFAVRDDEYKYVLDFYDGESLHDVKGELVEDPHWICADFKALGQGQRLPESSLLWEYRLKLERYLLQYGMTMQHRRLMHLASPGKGPIKLKDYPITYCKARGNFPFKMFLRHGDACVGGAEKRGNLWEGGTTRFITKTLKPGQVFVDVGAHVGYFTLLAASLVGPEGRVIAFEPNSESADILWANVRLHGYEDRVTLFRAAASDVTARTMLYKYGKPKNHGQYTLVEGLGDKPFHAHEEVDAVAIDSCVSQAGMVKLDCEGMEMRAFAGMPVLLEKSPGLILIVEDHDGLNRTALEDKGFKVIDTDHYKHEKTRNVMMQRGERDALTTI